MWFASVAVLALRYVTGIVPLALIWCSRFGLLDLCCLTPSVCPLCAACLNVFGLHCVACSALIALLYPAWFVLPDCRCLICFGLRVYIWLYCFDVPCLVCFACFVIPDLVCVDGADAFECITMRCVVCLFDLIRLIWYARCAFICLNCLAWFALLAWKHAGPNTES